MISQGFLGNLGSIETTPQSYVQAYGHSLCGPRDEAIQPPQDFVAAKDGLHHLSRWNGKLRNPTPEHPKYRCTQFHIKYL